MDTEVPMDEYLTVAEVAAALRVSEETIRNWLRSGRLEGSLPGGRKAGYRIAKESVDRLMRETTNQR
jgi:excisionase family DNA binding protein